MINKQHYNGGHAQSRYRRFIGSPSCFHFTTSGDPEDHMKRFLQTLVKEIAEVDLKTTFPTSCRGHLVLCTRLLLSLWLGVTTERTIRFDRSVVR